MRWVLGIGCGVLVSLIGTKAGATASWWGFAGGVIGGFLGCAFYDAYLRKVPR
jgi:hypothetical protein